MEKSDYTPDPEWITAGYIREALNVSKTQSYEIIKDIESKDRTKGAVLRYGTQVRVRYSAFLDWVEEHTSPGGYDGIASRFIPTWRLSA